MTDRSTSSLPRSPSGSETGPPGRRRLLLVDDEAPTLEALSTLLERRLERVTIDTSESAGHALEMVAAVDYDAIVSDIKMPGMDGFELMKRVLALRPTTPTLLITGHGDRDLAVKALQSGAYAFIQKPIDREYFLAWLHRAMQLRELSRQVESHNQALERQVHQRTVALELRNEELRAALALQRQSQQTAEQIREQLQLISDHVPSLISYVDTDCRYRFCNLAYTSWFGLSPEAIVGKAVWEVLGDEAWETIAPYLHSALRGEALEFETEVRYRTGGVRGIHASYRPHRSVDGRVVGVVVLVNDVSEAKRAEQRTAAVSEASRAFAESLDFDRALGVVARLMVPAHADWCLIDLFEDGTTCRRVAVTVSKPEKQPIAEELLRAYAPDLTRPDPILEAIRTGRTDHHLHVDPGWVAPRTRDARHAALLEEMELTGIIIVPLKVQDRVVGTLSLVSSRWSGRTFTRADVAFAEEIGRRASVALESACLYEGLRRELEDRRRAESALRESEARFRAIFSQATAGVAQTDRTGRFVLVNRRFCEMLGYSEAELMALRMQDVTHPEDLPANLELFERLVAGGRDFVIEKRYRRKDGSMLWVRVNVGAVREGSELRYVMGVALDITERKRTDEQLRRLNEELRRRVHEFETLLNTVPVGIGVATDPTCRFIWGNPEFSRMLGIELGRNHSKSTERDRLPFRVLRDGREVDAEDLPMQRACRTAQPILDEELDVVRADGTRLHELCRARPLFDESGRVRGCIGAFLDITERKRAEQGIKSSEEILQQIFRTAPVGLCLIDEQARIVMVNPECAAIFGYAPEEMMGMEAMALLAEGQEDAAHRSLQARLAGDETPRQWRVVTKPGRQRIVRSNIGRTVVMHGRRCLLAVLQDVTGQESETG